MAEDQHAVVAIHLVGGPADGLVFRVPEPELPKFISVGYPVLRYEPEPGTNEDRIFRYVTVH